MKAGADNLTFVDGKLTRMLLRDKKLTWSRPTYSPGKPSGGRSSRLALQDSVACPLSLPALTLLFSLDDGTPE